MPRNGLIISHDDTFGSHSIYETGTIKMPNDNTYANMFLSNYPGNYPGYYSN